MDKCLHIIMPLAGEGLRFKDAGYQVPKPLLPINGKEVYRHAMDSLDFSKYRDINIKRTFIIREEYIKNYKINKQIQRYYPDSNIVKVKETTRGALETLMLAKKYIKDTDYIVCIDCDIAFKSENYINCLYECYRCDSEFPVVMSFYSKNPMYSYAIPMEEYPMYAKRLYEKNPVSTHALGGCYGLGLGKNLKRAAKQYIDDFNKGKIQTKELYVSLVINYIMTLANVYTILYDLNMYKEHYWSFGTPQDYENYSYNRNIWDK